MALPRWDLTPFFPSIQDRCFAAAHEHATADVARLVALYDRHDVRGGPPRPPTPGDRAVLAEVIGATNGLLDHLGLLSAYLYALVTTDTRDDLAAGHQSELQQQTVALAVLTKRFESWVARLGADALLDGTADADVLADHAFVIRRAEQAAAHQLSEAEEALAAEL